MAFGQFQRCPQNPILTPADFDYQVSGVFNPGVVELDGEVVLFLRISDRRGISQIRLARSRNGVDGWRIADEPLLAPDLPEYPFEEWGCEDPRVTQIGHREWIIAYTAYCRYGPAVALATTTDCECATRLGVVLPPTNKDATVFARRIAGEWLMLHRPVTGEQEHIWYTSARDGLEYWGKPGILFPSRAGAWWDGLRIGVGAPPIETDAGWLLIYHGIKIMAERPVYSLGFALLDKDNPRKVLARSEDWVFEPTADYELCGLSPNVVFTCGAIPRGDEIWMYYGAADTVVALATAKTDDLLDFVQKSDYLARIRRDKGMIR